MRVLMLAGTALLVAMALSVPSLAKETGSFMDCWNACARTSLCELCCKTSGGHPLHDCQSGCYNGKFDCFHACPKPPHENHGKCRQQCKKAEAKCLQSCKDDVIYDYECMGSNLPFHHDIPFD